MATYQIPKLAKLPKTSKKQVLLVASGDLRLSANQNCWAAQKEMEDALAEAVADAGYELVRAHPYKEDEKHGFIGSQKEGHVRLRRHRPRAPSSSSPRPSGSTRTTCWPGCSSHRGPILTVANWSGTWPGLVGMLNLNGSLTKAGVKYSTLWSEDFTDEPFREEPANDGSRRARSRHSTNHVTPLKKVKVPGAERRAGRGPGRRSCAARRPSWASSTRAAWACTTPSSPTSCSTRRASTRNGSASRPSTTRRRRSATTRPRPSASGWTSAGMKFVTGPNEETDLTDEQILTAVQDVHRRRADRRRFRLRPDRHPVPAGPQGPAAGQRPGRGHAQQRRPSAGHAAATASGCSTTGEPLLHFNEVDECAGLDGLMTYRVHKAMGQPVENTLHDVRWGDWDRSGTVERLRLGVPDQRLGSAGPFRRRLEGRDQRAAAGRCTSACGGGTLKGISQAGRNRLVADLRRGRAR